jgi:hypothetical protein
MAMTNKRNTTRGEELTIIIIRKRRALKSLPLFQFTTPTIKTNRKSFHAKVHDCYKSAALVHMIFICNRDDDEDVNNNDLNDFIVEDGEEDDQHSQNEEEEQKEKSQKTRRKTKRGTSQRQLTRQKALQKELSDLADRQGTRQCCVLAVMIILLQWMRKCLVILNSLFGMAVTKARSHKDNRSASRATSIGNHQVVATPKQALSTSKGGPPFS